MGQLMKFMGPDRIVFGSDSVWYGSPQWQIDAFWRFQIPEEMRKKYGYPELTHDAKRKILGLNSARLYGIKEVERGNLGKRYKPVPKDYENRMSKELKTMLEFRMWADRRAPLDGLPCPQGRHHGPPVSHYGGARLLNNGDGQHRDRRRSANGACCRGSERGHAI